MKISERNEKLREALLQETLDKIYDTIKIKIKKDQSADASFFTGSDTYDVMIGAPIGRGSIPLENGGSFAFPGVCSIAFRSRKYGMGNREVEANDRSTIRETFLVYSTIIQVILDYVKKSSYLPKEVFGFTCSVAGDNSRGSKEEVYKLLFKKASKFGWMQIGDKLLSLRKDMYDKIKKNGVLVNGEVRHMK